MAKKKYEDHKVEFVRDYPDTDLFAYFGPIRRPFDDEVIELFEERAQTKLNKNLVFALCTLGGDPDAAYRIARCIQSKYGLMAKGQDATNGKVSIFVDSICASAGTLIALSANELILTEYAELSPLDIQVRKPDDIFERDSGLTPTQALDLLERRSKSLFKTHFNQLRLDSEMGLTTKTAVDVASNVTSGLLSEIYAQLDPMRLGEFERLMNITAMYGERLGKFNCNNDALAKLLTGYPSHNFVIDKFEAKELFKNVVDPKPGLRGFGTWFRNLAQRQMNERRPVKFFLTDAPQVPAEAEAATVQGSDAQGEHAHDAEAAAGNGTAETRAPSRRRTPGRTGETAQRQ